MLANLPVARSSGARALFFLGALVTAAILWWASGFGGSMASQLSPIFLVLFVVWDPAGANCALLIMIAAALIWRRDAFGPLLIWISRHILAVAGGTTLLLCAGALLVYRNHPLSMDEYVSVFQSRVFAAGRMAGHVPAPLLDWLVPPAFQNYFLNVSHPSGAVVSAYWPSFALLLTPFTWLGIPWACNPVISGAIVLVNGRLANRLFGSVEAVGLAVLLTLASPAFFADGVAYYSMQAHLLANAVYCLLLLDPTPRRCCAAGVVGSIALTLHNPFPHMLFALPWVLWLARRTPGGALALMAGYLPLVLLLGLGWFLFSTDLMQSAAGGSPTGERVVAMGSAFALPDAAILCARLIGLAKLWLWSAPVLLLLAGIGAWRSRGDTLCQLLTWSALLTLGGYIFVPLDQGHGWGYRYFHPAFLTLPLLAVGALGLPRTPAAGAPDAPARGPLFTDEETRTFVVACALLSMLAGVGLRAVQMRVFMDRHLEQLPPYSGTAPAIVFIDPTFSFYGQDLVQNDPFLRGQVINMLSHGVRADAQLMATDFPHMQRIFADPRGTVWSASIPSPAAASR